MQNSKTLRKFFDDLRDPEHNANGIALVQAELLLDIRDLLVERLPVLLEDTSQPDRNPEDGSLSDAEGKAIEEYTEKDANTYGRG